MTEQTLHIQAYSILEYTQKIKEAIEEGFEFKLDTNEGTCQQIGFYYEVMMYKKEVDYQELDKTLKPENVKAVSPELEAEITAAIGKTQAQKPRGRPAK
jgi:hypothetical protein